MIHNGFQVVADALDKISDETVEAPDFGAEALTHVEREEDPLNYWYIQILELSLCYSQM